MSKFSWEQKLWHHYVDLEEGLRTCCSLMRVVSVYSAVVYNLPHTGLILILPGTDVINQV